MNSKTASLFLSEAISNMKLIVGFDGYCMTFGAAKPVEILG